eukprot:5489421-Karenia_brevis.AAC.1
MSASVMVPIPTHLDSHVSIANVFVTSRASILLEHTSRCCVPSSAYCVACSILGEPGKSAAGPDLSIRYGQALAFW